MFHIFAHYGYDIHKTVYPRFDEGKNTVQKYIPSSYHVQKHGSDKTIVWKESNVLASKYNAHFHSHGNLLPHMHFES